MRDGVTLSEASDWVARITLSLVTYPEDFLNDEESLRRYLRIFLVTSLIKDYAGGLIWLLRVLVGMIAVVHPQPNCPPKPGSAPPAGDLPADR